ncbi:isocitrate lyase/PEP mutase family protein [Roseomonas xinghualingensis]|uniref:isocitrate lyase/PEP mutase family protein n=1 Tax=Roseomonas xinghualingensis TaxID=2986475 RepID=UPI0021F21D63|nr:isocitrate lyase/PEP mutase family protein [Roseomonas sp. SXEYE001]MCV4210293.1 isocitrate lyase/PEP mutase family protein [Roseomonas sp. SXEYE001]
MNAHSHFRDLVASERPLVLPGAHDALTARLIQRASFKAYFIGGFPVAGVRHTLPDIRLLGQGEFQAAYRDILAASDLPVLLDADNGYGDVKNIVHIVQSYERLGAQAIFFEDQASPKRCGHIAGKELLSTERMEANIRAAAGERLDRRTFIIARADAREVYSLDEALRRGERYLRAGADGLFREAPLNVDEMAQITRELPAVQLANMLEGGLTPLLSPSKLAELGFEIVIYGISLMMHAVRTMQAVRADIASGEFRMRGQGIGFEAFKELVDMPRWSETEGRYRC